MALNLKAIKWIAEQNGTMVRIVGYNLDGTVIAGYICLGAEGETPEEAICEALMMEGITYDEAFDVAVTAKWTWAD